MFAIDVIIDSTLWNAQPAAADTVRRAGAAAAATASTSQAELAIVLTDDSRIRVLNRDWRNTDKATNVLSFPAAPAKGKVAPRQLGDIVIAYETTCGEALAEGKPFLHHLAHLAVHGVLHLAGYDHEAEDEAETMEALERTILARLDVPDPYLSRDAGT